MTFEQLLLTYGQLIAIAIAIGSGFGAFIKVTRTAGLSAANSKQLDEHTIEIARLRETVNSLSEANDALNTVVDKQTRELKQKDAQIMEMRSQLNQADERQRAAENTQSRMQGQLDEQRLNYESMIDRQQRRLEELITTNAVDKQKAISLEKQLKEEQQKHVEQKTIVVGLENELERAKNELVLTKSELALTKNELAEAKDELARLREELSVTNRTLVEEKAKRIAMESVVADLRTKVERLTVSGATPAPPGFEADPPLTAGI